MKSILKFTKNNLTYKISDLLMANEDIMLCKISRILNLKKAKEMHFKFQPALSRETEKSRKGTL